MPLILAQVWLQQLCTFAWLPYNPWLSSMMFLGWRAVHADIRIFLWIGGAIWIGGVALTIAVDVFVYHQSPLSSVGNMLHNSA